MILVWIAAGALLGWILMRFSAWLGRRTQGRWRTAAGLLAVAAAFGAAMALVRGAGVAALVLALAAAWLAISARRRLAKQTPPPPRQPETMSLAEARSVLGIRPEAGEAEVQAAYRRLMARAHPDAGGSEGLAARLNAARDRLLKPPVSR